MSTFRGHAIYQDADGLFRFVDTDEPTVSTWRDRPCGHCGEHNTAEGHDACLGTLPGVANACCGHGNTAGAYVQREDGQWFGGADAVAEIQRLRGRDDDPYDQASRTYLAVREQASKP